MTYTIKAFESGTFKVINIHTQAPYGPPVASMEEAVRLVREAEAQGALDKMFCRAGSCSI